MLMNRCVILNPWAGRGLAGQQRHKLEQALHEAGLACDLVTTHARGGATDLAYQAIEGNYQQIIAVGGDGTLNEIVNGIVDSARCKDTSTPCPQVTLGIVPIGTGCDFMKSIEGVVPNDIPNAVQRLIAGNTRRVDVGSVKITSALQEVSRYFLNGLGMGVDAHVAAESIKLTRLRGLAVYLVAAIRALASYRSHPMRVRFDDQLIQRRFLMASVANGRCQGGGFWLTPDALIDDGLLDICLVNRIRLDQILRYLPTLLDGTHTHLRFVTMGRARCIEVESTVPFLVATDGEIVATDARALKIEVLPQALEIV